MPSAVVDVEIVGLADKADGGRVRVQNRRQHVVIVGRPPGPLGHAEGGEGGAGLGPCLEERAVGRVRPGPAAFDIVEAERVERLARSGSSRRVENWTPCVCCPSRSVVS